MPNPSTLLPWRFSAVSSRARGVQEILPVDWEVFKANDKVQPMKVVPPTLETRHA